MTDFTPGYSTAVTDRPHIGDRQSDRPPRRLAAVLVALGTFLAAGPLHAELLRLEILSTKPFEAGRTFGPAGPYELVIARAYFAVDPDTPANRTIVDLRLAPRGADGRVHFSADVTLLRPVDPHRGNGTLVVEIVNRGGRGWIAERAGNEGRGADRFFAARGFTVAWVGWQFDVPEPLVGLEVPSARDGDAPLLGQVSHAISVAEPQAVVALPAAYPAADLDGAGHVLARRDRIGGPYVEIPRNQWRFVRTENGTLVPDSAHVALDGEFQPGPLYLLTYVSANPPVAGLGFAAIRDFVSWAKGGRDGRIHAERAIAQGGSQSGRFLRDLVREGFNADEDGAIVLDGVIPYIAGAGGGFFNFRFAQPGVAGAFGIEPTPNDRFPFTDLPERDPFTGRDAGLLDRAYAAGVVPRIFYVNASSEYDDRGAALIHMRPDGSGDAPIPETTRIYTVLGAPHGGPADPGPRQGLVAYMGPDQLEFPRRAFLVAMHRWLAEGAEPPPSRYPRIADGTLVPHDAARFLPLPGFGSPAEIYEVAAYDFGRDVDQGVLTYPPRALGEYPAFVPAVDEDGNELGGLRMPEVEVPLATYTGWNLRAASDDWQLANLSGSYLPFPADRATREATGDPRPSIAERYASREEYLARYAAAARALITEGFVLEEDFEDLMQIAERRWEFHQTRPPLLPVAGGAADSGQ